MINPLPNNPFPKQVLVFTCLHYRSFEKIVGNGEIALDEQFLLFIRPSKTGRIMLSPVAGRWRPPFFVRAYLQDYASYCYETSWVDRSHQEP